MIKDTPVFIQLVSRGGTGRKSCLLVSQGTSSLSDLDCFSAAAGEYLVLGQLLRKRIPAFLAQGPTQKGWDIVIDTSFRKIQVKTISWPERTAVNGNLTDGFDFLVVVLLNEEGRDPRYLIFKSTEVENYLSKPNPARKQQHKRTLTIGKNFDKTELAKHEDKWDLLH